MIKVQKRTANVTLALILAILLGIIAGFRPFGVGKDFYQYLQFYSQIDNNFNPFSHRFELGFVLSAMISKLILGLDYVYFAAFLAASAVAIKMVALRELENPFRAIAFYIFCWFPLFENTQLRVAVAISVLFIASRCLVHNKWLSFAILSAVACMFHMTAAFGAIVLLIAYHLSRHKISIGIVCAVAAAALFYVSLPISLKIMNDLNPLLIPSISASETPKIFSAINVTTMVFLIIAPMSGILNDRSNKMYYLVMLAGVAVFIGFASIPVAAHRLKEMLFVFMTFIAFEYRFTWRTLPLAVVACLLAVGSLYVYITDGFFSN